jgi:hypothetical protein
VNAPLRYGTRLDMTPAQLAWAYSVPAPIDYGPERGNGILFAIGSGLMMAAMDQLPHVRWALDVGGPKQGPHILVQYWCEALPWVVDHICVAAWFTITDPSGFERVYLKALPADRLAVWSRPRLHCGINVDSLDELVALSATLSRSVTGDPSRG